MKNLTFLLLFLLPAPPAAAAQPGTYDYGMEQRKSGDYEGAKKTFMNLLLQSPASGGALEGLSLACLSLGQYEEARIYLEQWNKQSPHNTYILGLLARAQNALKDGEAALVTYRDLSACDPRDCAVRSRMDSSMTQLRGGVFPRGRTYKSYSMEGLDTSSPQRILYEGSSGGSRFREKLRQGLDLIGGAEVRREAQLNAGHGFTYYDIQEQVYSAGLNGRPSRGLEWEAEYGRSLLSDLNSSAVGHKQLNRVRLAGEWQPGALDLKLTLTSLPRFVRGSGGGGYFELMRENAARVEAGGPLWGWDWLGRAGLYHTSDGTTLGTFSERGVGEYGGDILQAGYSHGQQEFYSASASGRLQYVNTDAVSAGWRRSADERYRAGVSAGYTSYSDSNGLLELGTELTGWLPWNREFYGSYRFSLEDFRTPRAGYNSIDTQAHWLGAYWRKCRGRNWSALAGYERGFLHDISRGYYGGNNYLAEFDWYYGAGASVHLQGRKSDTTVRDNSYSAGLQARYSFE